MDMLKKICKQVELNMFIPFVFGIILVVAANIFVFGLASKIMTIFMKQNILQILGEHAGIPRKFVFYFVLYFLNICIFTMAVYFVHCIHRRRTKGETKNKYYFLLLVAYNITYFITITGFYYTDIEGNIREPLEIAKYVSRMVFVFRAIIHQNIALATGCYIVKTLAKRKVLRLKSVEDDMRTSE